MKSLRNIKFLEKASQQALAEILGYDEGKVYYLMLSNKEEKIAQEFSCSKRYRILKALFEKSATSKVKEEGHDFFKYLLLPPSFLYFHSIDKEIIEFLEKIYLVNHLSLIEKEFEQIILKDDRGIMIFLLKYFMKENAKMLIEDLNIGCILEEKYKMIKVIKNKTVGKRMGIIDKKIAFEFMDVPTNLDKECIGYIAHKQDDNKNFLVEETLNKYFY